MNASDLIERLKRARIAEVRALRIRAAIAEMYDRDPDKAAAHVNERLDMGNRTEYERLPVTL